MCSDVETSRKIKTEKERKREEQRKREGDKERKGGGERGRKEIDWGKRETNTHTKLGIDVPLIKASL